MREVKTIRVVGIDPGVARMGFACVESTGQLMKCLEYGTVTTPANTPLPGRLLHLHQELEKILERHKPDKVAVEKLFFSKNITTGIDVSQARGVILLTATKAGIPIVEATPLQVKRTISGYGQADKKQVQKMVQILLRLPEPPKSDDAADAIALAIYASVNLVT